MFKTFEKITKKFNRHRRREYHPLLITHPIIPNPLLNNLHELDDVENHIITSNNLDEFNLKIQHKILINK